MNSSAAADERANSTPHRDARILVVDDDAHARSMVGATLERQRYDVQFAAGCSEPLEFLERNACDLVLSDIAMRDGDGLAMLERIRGQRPGLRVVMVAAIHNISGAIESIRRGAYDYLLKPFEEEHLLRTVHRALNHRQSMQESNRRQQSLEQVVRAKTDVLGGETEDLDHSYDVVLEALNDALELRDSETEGHSKRVTAYTVALALALGIAPAEIRMIARGAILHDIGKMAIPDEILRKPGKLTAEEQRLMREHCLRGYSMLRKIPFLSHAAEIALTHHEHYDGCGYPSQLRSSEIPIGSRIFAVADALDAITSDRPYRKARGFDAAREEIVRCSGTQFDPSVVEAFLTIRNEMWCQLRSEITDQKRRL